jgi:iron-sulfur cluster assembly protein/iron-sulfur cluster insertion protein
MATGSFNLDQMSNVNTEQPVELTANAVVEVRNLLATPENAGKHFRVYVEQGGCSGMQYGMVFDEQRDGDIVGEQDGLRILVDGFSANYLRGTQVDFSDALTGGGFKISNPNARQSCGCGKSFQA